MNNVIDELYQKYDTKIKDFKENQPQDFSATSGGAAASVTCPTVLDNISKRQYFFFCLYTMFFSLDLDVNIISPLQQDNIGYGNLITPNPISNDDDAKKETKE
jgi:hypothetical protein